MKLLALCFLLLLVPSLVIGDSPVAAGSQDQGELQSNDKIQDNLENILSSDPILSGADVQVQVNDQTITLTGTVESYAQHQRALQLVQPYARTKKIVDKIKTVNQQTKYAALPGLGLFWA